jgi:NADP-dependent 3-hydroxy acid dehydrogenase YdfG
MEVTGKIAIVTGVSTGIGLATVKALIDAGAIVAGWGRKAPAYTHERFHFFEADVRNFASVESAFNKTVTSLGDHIAILVNNAGLGSPALFEEITLDHWHEMFETNVNGVFYCSKLVIPLMKQREEGHIINLSSIAGTTGIENMSAYCGTKFAVRGISQSIYKELRPFGIKVTCIYPGSVKTNFFDVFPNVTLNDSMMRPEDIATTIVQAIQTHPNFHVVDVEVRPLKPKK